MGVADELKKTNKGLLRYKRELSSELVQKLTDEVSAPPKLFIYHPENTSYRTEGKVVPSLQSPDEKQDKGKDEVAEKDVSASSSKAVDWTGDCTEEDKPLPTSLKLYTSPPVSPDYGRTSLQIRHFEVMFENKAKDLIEAKRKQFERNEQELQLMVEQKANQLEEKQREEMRRLYEQTSRLQLKEKAEKQEDSADERQPSNEEKGFVERIQDDKLLEGERKKLQLQEEERRRNEQEKRQAVLQQCYLKIKQTHDNLTALYDNCKYKQHLPESAQAPKQVCVQIMAKADSMMKKGDLAMEEVQGMRNLMEYSKNTFDFMVKHLEEATRKGKAEEAELAKQQQQKQQQQQQQQQQQAQQKAAAEAAQAASASTPGVPATTGTPSAAAVRQSVIDEVVTEYELYKAKLDDMTKSLAAFTANTQMKKYRFELQKSVNTPINSIAPVDGSNLRDKLQKLIHLLGGHQIEGKHVSAKDAPEGIPFCKNLIARMFVRKGEEQVSSKHESAFAIAMVAAGLWLEHSDIGDLMMAHFHSFCPYIVPLYIPKDSSMSSQDYHRMLGYKVDSDGTIEAQDKFLKRMSGIMRLYTAILVSSPPRSNAVHPHGIEHAWIWLARILNMDPQPDITATLTYDMLQVTGHTLFSVYKVQFVKLLFLLYKEFLPKLKSVSVAGGPVARLEQFLEKTLNKFKMKQIMPHPDGYLAQNFWFS
ncbi:mRNA export factor GLE1-like [Haliotis rubra]|uniref:mRNA export factor GLE1-like n=1 Tax=Haliotis rubra TaxID=36100 RepID=UPI001EE5FA9E|nr:mRNA export factor GLE1-like [Haliotis rubra]